AALPTALPTAPPQLALFVHQVDQHAAQRAADQARDEAPAPGPRGRVEREEEDADRDPAARADQVAGSVVLRRGRFLAGLAAYSHSIVPGGLLVMSSTTRVTSR